METINCNNIKSIKGKNLSGYQDFVIRIVGISNRKGSNLGGNCSGFNINKELSDGMTVREYQQMILRRFSKSDPQFCLTKHLKYDIKHGFVELRKE